MKKVLCFFLIACLVLMNFPSFSSAASNNFSGSNQNISQDKSSKKTKVKEKKRTRKEDADRAIAAERAFYSLDYPVAIETFEFLRSDKDRNIALWNNQLGSIYLSISDYEKALDSFVEAYYMMNDNAAFSKLENKATSLMGAESEKAYKGDPYEKVYNSFYAGVLFMRKGDLDNALAAFKNGILCDSDVESELYKSDVVLLYFLAARVEALKGDESMSKDYFDRSSQAYKMASIINRDLISELKGKIALLDEKREELVKLSPPEEDKAKDQESSSKQNFGTKEKKKSKKVIKLEKDIVLLEEVIEVLNKAHDENNSKIDVTRLKEFIDLRNNTLLFVELGRGPVKFPIGKYGQIGVFTQKLMSARSVKIVVDGKDFESFDKVLENNDPIYQATTRGGRMMDSILKGQANFKEATEQISYQLSRASQQLSNQASQMSQQASYYGSGGAAALGCSYAALGIAAVSLIIAIVSDLSNPAADVRHWSLLPGEIKVFPLRLNSGTHTFQIQVFDSEGNNLSGLEKSFDVDIKDDQNIIIRRIVE